eukprot:scaffold35167_cov33-Tisochrysis_lutea.AAC.3
MVATTKNEQMQPHVGAVLAPAQAVAVAKPIPACPSSRSPRDPLRGLITWRRRKEGRETCNRCKWRRGGIEVETAPASWMRLTAPWPAE